MDKRKRARLVQQTEVLKAIASPIRLFVLEELSSGEKCVSFLSEGAGVSLSALSHHLSIMKKAGILDFRKEKNSVYYRLDDRTSLSVRVNAESILIHKTRKLRSLCRTEEHPVKRERRKRWGRNILKGRIF